MATLQFQENYYSFRNTERLIGAVAHTQSPDQAALAAIEAKMVEANNDFHKQRYQDAISAYSEAETLIYRHLARTYAERGNSKAAEFFRGRAQATDQATVALLDRAAEQTPPAGPELLSGHADITVQRVTDGVVGVRAAPIPALATMDRSLGAIVGGRLANFNWSAGDAPPLDGVRAAIYEKRVSLVALADLINPSIEPSDVALDLPHNYYYVIPLGLAECYHALGDYATAEGHYFQAASYQFLNTAIEAPYLWQRLAILYLDWGNSLFRNDEAADALPIYVRVLMPDGTVPSSALYTTAAL